MNLSDFERAVAHSTGETRREIRRRGFQPLPADAEFRFVAGEQEDAATVCVVDWDKLESQRPVLFP